LLASASDNGLHASRIWDVASKEQAQVLDGHIFAVNGLAWNRDSKLLASGSTDSTVRLWDTATWREIAVLKHGNNVFGVAFNPDGTRLVSASGGFTVRIWDTVWAPDRARK
jgi:WD40 repeat protein